MNNWNTMLGNTAQVQSQAQTSSTITLGATGSVASPITWGTGTGSPLSNSVVYTTGTGALSWGNITADPGLKGNSLSVKGDADFDGEVTIKGKNLTDMLEKIEERLAILHPNPKLEDKWDELKELGKRYKELEAEIIEKEKVWSILKR